MKKKFIFGSIIVALLVLVNPLMFSQTVKADNPEIYIGEIYCDSIPIEKNHNEWFNCSLTNHETYNVTVDVEFWFNYDYYNTQFNLTIPAAGGGCIYSQNFTIHWPNNYGNYPVTFKVNYSGEIIATETLSYSAPVIVIYSFDNYADSGPGSEAWETNPSYMTDLGLNNYAETTINSDVELLNGNTCPGTDLGTITSVWIRAKAYYSGNKRILMLRPVFTGPVDGINYEFTDISTTAAWSPWFDITDDDRAPETWTWTDVKDLDCDVEAKTNGMSQFTLYCSIVEIRVCYT